MKWISAVAIAAACSLGACERIPGTKSHAIAMGKQHAAANLFDPGAAQFRNLALHEVQGGKQASKGPKRVVCGEVNGKNRNGAYVGFSRFVADPDSENVVLEPTPGVTQEEAQLAAAECQRSAKLPLYSEGERDSRVAGCRDAARMMDERAEWGEFEILYLRLCSAPIRR